VGRSTKLALLACALALPQALLAQWGPTVRLSNSGAASSADVDPPLVADGQIVLAFWSDTVSGGRSLYYSRSTDNGVSWSSPAQLAQSVTNWYYYPANRNVSGYVRRGRSGALHLLYCTQDTVQWACYRRSFDNGATWTAAETLGKQSTYGQGWRLASDGNGHLYVSWSCHAYMLRRSTDDGITWEPMDTTSHQVDAIFAEDQPYVYCFGNRGADTVDLTRSTDRGATWEPPTHVTPCSSPDGAVDESGRLHLAWSSDQTGHEEVYYTRSTDHGVTWSSPLRLTVSSDAYISWLGVSGNSVCVSYLSGGTWRKRVSNDGGSTWGAESTWPYPWNGPCTDLCAVALGDAGRIHLLRFEWGLNNSQWIEYRRSRDFGGTWPDSAMLSDSNSLDRYPRAVVCDGNDVHVLWEDYEYGNYEIMYRRGVGLAGVEEKEGPPPTTHNSQPEATVVRGVLSVPLSSGVVSEAFHILLDATGRKLADLHPGVNDVSGLAPGVYFIREARAQAQAQAIRKVVLTR
jgi:hypothetical protein